jgi:uncharacterized protein YceK
MNLRMIMPAIGVTLLLNGCAAMKIAKIGTECDTSTKDYNRLVRWDELDNALSIYVSPSMKEEYRKRIPDAEKVKIVDYRVKTKECDPVKGVATVKVEIDYYRPPSITVKTLVDNQEWSYEGPEEGRVWRLKTLLPEFR